MRRDQVQGKNAANTLHYETGAVVRRAIADLGDLPLIVLSATLPFGDTPEELEAQALWIQTQEAQAALSTRGEFLAVEDSRHNIYVDQPQVVLDAVREIVEGAAAQ